MTAAESRQLFRRGPGGRPTQAEADRRHDRLLKTAAELFFTHGLQGVSIDAIAQAAGVAKRSIYARYADKGELFAAAITRLIEDRWATLMQFELTDAPVEEALLHFAMTLVEIALRPEALAFMRMMIAEAPRFPGVAKLDSERNRQTALSTIIRVLSAYAERGDIVLYDAEMQAELFAILVLRGTQHRALILGADDAAGVERRTRAAVRLFLDGCRPR